MNRDLEPSNFSNVELNFKKLNLHEMSEKAAPKMRYYAKLMLFGEYSIIHRSKALTVPFKHFSGELSFIPDNKFTNIDFAAKSNKQLRVYAQFIEQQILKGHIDFSLDIKKLLSDIDSGLYFDSSIPQGYGAGSSGALIAALYDNYVTVKADSKSKLRAHLAMLENFFHGKSSGIDPLVAYVEKPLLIENETYTDVAKPDFSPTGQEALLLFDTQQTGKTEPLVNAYLADCLSGAIDKEYLISLNNQIIDAVLAVDYVRFSLLLTQLSAWQLKYMHRMIPESIQSHWQFGLESQLWTAKLCGSGGGGYVLAYTHNYEKALSAIKDRSISYIPVQTPESSSYDKA